MAGHRKSLKGYKRKEEYKSWPDTIAFQEEIYIKTVKLTHGEEGEPLVFPIEYVETNVPLHAVHHSPEGFNWGYLGSGPSDLAMNIIEELADKDVNLIWGLRIDDSMSSNVKVVMLVASIPENESELEDIKESLSSLGDSVQMIN